MEYDKPTAELIDFEKDFVLAVGPGIPWNPDYKRGEIDDSKIPESSASPYSGL